MILILYFIDQNFFVIKFLEVSTFLLANCRTLFKLLRPLSTIPLLLHLVNMFREQIIGESINLRKIRLRRTLHHEKLCAAVKFAI